MLTTRLLLAILFFLAGSDPPGLPPESAPPQTSAPEESAAKPTDGRVPPWTADARWYYITIPRFRNADKANDSDDTLAWTTVWPPLEPKESAPSLKTGELIPPHGRRYGGDLRGVIERIPYLKTLGVNAICLSPVFHGGGEIKLPQVDLRHVDDSIGVNNAISEANREGSLPETWVWTSSDRLLRELIHTAHEMGMRVVVGGFFYAVMSANAPPSDMEAYYRSATQRWMDPDGDGDPQDGVDGWLLSLDERGFRTLDDRYKAFWSRWREWVAKINPKAVVISSGTLALGQISSDPFDIALHTSCAGPLGDFFGSKEKRPQATSFFDTLESSAALAPSPTIPSNITLASGGPNARLLTAVAATEPLRKGRNTFPGPVPDEAARSRWMLATTVQHFLPGAPVTWYGDEVGMFGGPDHYAEAPMWWDEGANGPARSEHFQPRFYSLLQWLHRMRESYPVLRRGGFRRVLTDDVNHVLAFSRHLDDEEVILVVNYGDTKQLVMLPAGKPGQLVGVRSPALKPPRPSKKPEGAAMPGAEKAGAEFPHMPVIGARQFVNSEGKIRMWLEPMSVRAVFLNESP